MLRRAVRKHNTILSAQTVTLAARRPISPRRHRGHGDFTEASGFSVHLRVLRVSVVNTALEFFLNNPQSKIRNPQSTQVWLRHANDGMILTISMEEIMRRFALV